MAIRLVARAWHTDIALPAAAIGETPLGAALLPVFPGARHLVFGFGERGYFTNPEPGPLDMLSALSPGPGAILVTGLGADPEIAFPTDEVMTLRVSPAGLSRLAAFVWDDIERDAAGRPRALKTGPYAGSLFLASTAEYRLDYTCNTWTAAGLAAAGLAVRPEGALLVSQVMARARRAAALAEAGPAQ